MPEQADTFDSLATLDRLTEVLEEHVVIRSLREIKASSDLVRVAAHVIVDRAFDRVQSGE